MGKIIILNGSPRAPKSNSKLYSEIFMKKTGEQTEYFNISKKNHLELCQKLEGFSHILFVFPLYADGVPVTLLNFLKTLENNPPKNKPVVSIMINCGFMEPQQNNVAVRIMEMFCKRNGYKLGSVLKIASGEAILSTPFKIMVSSKIKKLAHSISKENYTQLQVTMPISKKMFLNASTKYWENYGKRNGVTKEEMDTMKIEGE